MPAIICGSVPTPATRRAAGLPAGGFLAIGLGLALAGPAAAQQRPADLAARFKQRVEAYETADKATPPPTNAILLAGDSQFDRWKTVHEDLAGYTVINRGIDSFTTSDLLDYADRLIVHYKPRLVVLHVGGNDINRKISPEQVLVLTKLLVAKIRAGLPGVPIAWSSITPGPGRWEQREQRQAANALVKEWIATENGPADGSKPGLFFIDLWDAMLTADGQPREDLWVADRVHPNHAGYQVRVRLTTPVLGPPDRK